MRQIVVILKSVAAALLALVASGLFTIVILDTVYKASSARAVAISLRSPLVWVVVAFALAAGYWQYRGRLRTAFWILLALIAIGSAAWELRHATFYTAKVRDHKK